MRIPYFAVPLAIATLLLLPLVAADPVSDLLNQAVGPLPSPPIQRPGLCEFVSSTNPLDPTLCRVDQIVDELPGIIWTPPPNPPSVIGDPTPCFIVTDSSSQSLVSVIEGALQDPGPLVDGTVQFALCPLVKTLPPKVGFVLERDYQLARDRTPLACWVPVSLEQSSVILPDPNNPDVTPEEHTAVHALVCAYEHADSGLPNLLQGACVWTDDWTECF